MSEPAAYGKLARGGGLVVLGNGTAAALGLVLLVILARGLSPQDLAIVVAIIAVIDGGQMFLDATVNMGMVHVASKRSKSEVPDAVSLRIGFIAKIFVGAALVLAAVLASGPMSVALVGDASLQGLIVLAALAALVAGVQSSILAILTAHGAFAKMAIVSVWKNALRVMVAVPILFQTAPDPIALGQMLCLVTLVNLAASALLIDWSFLRAKGPWIEPLRAMMTVNGWMFISAVVMLLGRMDVWLVGWLSTAEQAGYYAVAAQLCVGVGVVTQALVSTFLPTVSRFETRSQIMDFLRRTSRASIILLAFPVAAWLLAEWVITLVFGATYTASAPIFVVLFIASLMTLVGAPLMLVLLSINETRVLALGTSAQMALKIGAAFIAVPIAGGLGLAVVDVAARMVAMLLILRVIFKALARHEDQPDRRLGETVAGG